MSGSNIQWLRDFVVFSFFAFILNNAGRIYIAGESESWGLGVIVPSLVIGLLAALELLRQRKKPQQ